MKFQRIRDPKPQLFLNQRSPQLEQCNNSEWGFVPRPRVELIQIHFQYPSGATDQLNFWSLVGTNYLRYQVKWLVAMDN